MLEMSEESPWKYGSIWWTQCSPSHGNEFRDRHPTVIIHNEQLQRKGMEGLLTIMIMSSYKGKKGPHDFLVPSTPDNGLLRPTLLKVEYVTSYDKSRFLKKIGDLECEWVDKIKEYLRTHFDL